MARWVAIGAVALVMATACSSSEPVTAPATTPTTVESTASTTPTTSTSTSTSTSAPPDPDAPVTFPIVARSWDDPELLGFIDTNAFGAPMSDGRWFVHFERTGETFEGCEGERASRQRLVATDFETMDSIELIEDPATYGQTIHLGPDGRFAIMAGCDANAWLAVIGSVTPDGPVDFFRISYDPEQRAGHAGNNAGYSVTWSADGAVLYVDSTRLDASNGALLDAPEPDQPWWFHAELADGSRLVSRQLDSSSARAFWLLEPSEAPEVMPERPPLFTGEATYPVAQVEIAADGEAITVTVDRWSQDERTYLITADDLVELPGAAAFNSDRSMAVVRTVRPGDGAYQWHVVDLLAATSSAVPTSAVPATVYEVEWSNDEEGLLMTGSAEELTPTSFLEVWYVGIPT